MMFKNHIFDTHKGDSGKLPFSIRVYSKLLPGQQFTSLSRDQFCPIQNRSMVCDSALTIEYSECSMLFLQFHEEATTDTL